MHLGELLIKAGLISPDQLDTALDSQQQIGGKLGTILVKLGYISEDALVANLSDQLQVPIFALEQFTPDDKLMQKVPQEVLERVQALPLQREMGAVVVGVADPCDFEGIDEIRMHIGETMEIRLVKPHALKDVLNRYYYPEGVVEPVLAEAADEEALREHRAKVESLLNRDLARIDATRSLFNETTTRHLLLGLIAALNEKKLLSNYDIARAIQKIEQDHEAGD